MQTISEVFTTRFEEDIMDLSKPGKVIIRIIYVCCDCPECEQEKEGTQRWYRCGFANGIIEEHVAEHGFPKWCPLQNSA